MSAHRERRFRARDFMVSVIWTPWLPGDEQARQLYQVTQRGYLMVRTIDITRVRRALGDAVFAELTEVEL